MKSNRWHRLLAAVTALGALALATPVRAESPYTARNRQAAEHQLAVALTTATRNAVRAEARAALATRRTEIEAAVVIRLQQRSGRSEPEVRAEVEDELVAAAVAEFERQNTQSARAATADLMARNQAEMDQFVATRLGEIKAAGGLGNRTEDQVREELWRELTRTLQGGILEGRQILRSRAVAVSVLDTDERAALDAAAELMAALPALDPETAAHRLRDADQQLESVTLKMEALQRSYSELAPRVAVLRQHLGAVREQGARLRRQMAEQAIARAAEAAALLASGNDEAAVTRLQEAARLNPADPALVSQIVAIQKQAGAPERRIYVNGRPLVADPMVVESRTLVPLRAVAEAMGARVDWDGETRTVSFGRGDHQVLLIIDRKDITVDGRVVLVDVPARIYHDRTHVPLRAVAEMLNAEVTYDAETRAITVVDPAPAAVIPAR